MSDSSSRPSSAVTVEGPGSGVGRFVGRVGALAVALGVGAAVVSMPLAFADRRGPDGATGSAESGETPDRIGCAARNAV